MPLDPPHRKTVKHYDIFGHIHMLTFSCYQRRQLLTDADSLTLLSRTIDRAAERLGFGLIAFVFMPEHMHLLVHPKRSTCTIAQILYGIKKSYSELIKKRLQASKAFLIQRLTVQERPGKVTFRFWQEGPGFDRNIDSVKDCIIAAEYIHSNPIRRGLCESPDEWPWSSWKFYHDPEKYDLAALPRICGFPQ